MEKINLKQRSSGILLHLTSLPGGSGIGDMGTTAYRFVKFLSSCGQRWWQMLPLNPPGSGNSPYNSHSAFAGSYLHISLEKLVKDGLLSPDDLAISKDFSEETVEYERVAAFKDKMLRKAFEAYEKEQKTLRWAGFRNFCDQNRHWLLDHSLFIALKLAYKGKPWVKWNPDLRAREPLALLKAAKKLGREIHYQNFIQFIYFRQWDELKNYCAWKGVNLIGDVPIYVTHNSADVWANQDIFRLGENGKSTHVAGVPPDYFSRGGQLWGNPLYAWDVLKKQDYGWWMGRLRTALQRFDAMRLDHFIGFYRFWEIKSSSRTARKGKWVKGPRDDFFKAVFRIVGDIQLIAEDLGAVTPEVIALRKRFNIPGLVVLHFAFGKDPKFRDALNKASIKEHIIYTGTHDNDTTVSWFSDNGSRARRKKKRQIITENNRLFKCMGLGKISKKAPYEGEIHWDMIKLAMDSACNTSIIPLQDVLGLGSQARMNCPGMGMGNWGWRFKPGDVDEETQQKLLNVTKNSGRLIY
ncbi:4-alpha-glucanotransferase [Elusimicrobiota bacterium]